jgi:hypothetical protein
VVRNHIAFCLLRHCYTLNMMIILPRQARGNYNWKEHSRQDKASQAKTRDDKTRDFCGVFCLRLPLVRAILGPGAVRIHLGNTCRYTANKLNLHQGFCIVTTTL